jgi:hypothetical protein
MVISRGFGHRSAKPRVHPHHQTAIKLKVSKTGNTATPTLNATAVLICIPSLLCLLQRSTAPYAPWLHHTLKLLHPQTTAFSLIDTAVLVTDIVGLSVGSRLLLKDLWFPLSPAPPTSSLRIKQYLLYLRLFPQRQAENLTVLAIATKKNHSSSRRPEPEWYSLWVLEANLRSLQTSSFGSVFRQA